MSRFSFPLLRRAAAFALLPLLAVPNGFGWGSDGHRMINRLAMEKLPSDMPAFMRTPAAIAEVEYLGPEPDRWRSPMEPELNSAQAPEHFLDLELADVVADKNGELPRRRFDYIAALYAAQPAHPELNLKPEHVGLQPYVATEVVERLQAAMREYRGLSAKRQDTAPVEAAILFYAGWLGHYVGDGSQPLHVTINYNGWALPENPHGYTREHTIHSQFETDFVTANITAKDVSPKMIEVHIVKDYFPDYVTYLRHTGSLVERVYQLEKVHGFVGAGSAESRDFVAERLAAGASVLRDMIYTAWLNSAKPVPEYHESSQPVKPAGF